MAVIKGQAIALHIGPLHSDPTDIFSHRLPPLQPPGSWKLLGFLTLAWNTLIKCKHLPETP